MGIINPRIYDLPKSRRFSTMREKAHSASYEGITGYELFAMSTLLIMRLIVPQVRLSAYISGFRHLRTVGQLDHLLDWLCGARCAEYDLDSDLTDQVLTTLRESFSP